MDKHLILVRHSTPEINHAIPPNQWNLNETGTKRAQLLARELSSFPVDVIVSSPEPKALETAGIIASYQGLEPAVHNKLYEHDRSHTPFMAKSDFKEAMSDLFRNLDTLVFGSETATEAKERFEETILEILLDYPDEEIVVVSHGTVMALFVANRLKKDPYKIWRDMSMPTAYIFSRPGLELLSIIRTAKDEK